jgi:hypothetical protein
MINILGHITGALAIVSWFLAVLESIGMWLFCPWVFSLGPRVFRTSEVRANPKLLISSRFETRSAKFYVATPTECLFRHKSRFFGVSTPFPIKGRITLTPAGASVDGRIPLGTVGFFFFFLTGWSIFTVAMLYSPEQVINDSGIHPIMFGIFGFGFVAFIFAISLRLERARARQAIAEFTERHGGP